MTQDTSTEGEHKEMSDTNAVAIVEDQPGGVALNRAGVTSSGSLLLPSPEQLQTLQHFGEMYVKSGLLPDGIKNWQAVAVIIQHGMDLGIPISTAIQKISVIKGKPVCEASLMASLIYRDHGDDALKVVESTDKLATYAYKRRSWSDYAQYTYTIEDATKAGLLNKPGAGGGPGLWKLYPKSMLRARCLADIAHAQFQDTIGGLYLQDELDHLKPAAVGATVTPISPAAADSLQREVIEAETLEPIDWERLAEEAVSTNQSYEEARAKFGELVVTAQRRHDAEGFAILIARAPSLATAEYVYNRAHAIGLDNEPLIEDVWHITQMDAQEKQDARIGAEAIREVLDDMPDLDPDAEAAGSGDKS